jgi:hypothetical protein
MRGGASRDAAAMRSLLAQVAALGHEIAHYQSADPSLIVVQCSCGFATAPMFPTGAADATWTHGREAVAVEQRREWDRQREAARRRGHGRQSVYPPPQPFEQRVTTERAVVAAWHWHHGNPA